MKSKWYVSCNPVRGMFYYIAMRTRDTSEVKHSGNVETYGEYSTDREEIRKVVDKLNQEEGAWMFWIGLLVGLFVGGTVGVVIMGVIAVGSSGDERWEERDTWKSD